jgi:hypothetical protein
VVDARVAAQDRPDRREIPRGGDVVDANDVSTRIDANAPGRRACPPTAGSAADP